MRGVARAIWMGPALLAWLGLQACDVSFDPFQEPGRMSLYGALDASADTQWIRVTPVRQTILTTPDPIDATVTLERAGTGETVELRDSIVEFQWASAASSQTKWYTNNFWTTEPIEPGATYTVTVTGTDRVTATTTVPVPADYSVIVGYPRYGATVRAQYVPYLGLVLVRLYFAPDCVAQMGLPAPYLSLPTSIPQAVAPGVYEVGDLYPSPTVPPPCPVVERKILIVASGSPWPEGLRNVPSALGALSTPSDVENGVGFLGGVLTKSIPWQPCSLEPQTLDPCLLTYDSTSVTLQGRVWDALSGQPLAGAGIHLTEIIPDSAPPTKFRGFTDSLGYFMYGAVEPGVRHVFRVSQSTPCYQGGPPVWLDQVDTLPAYAPGEHVTVHDVVLQRNPWWLCEGYVYPTK